MDPGGEDDDDDTACNMSHVSLSSDSQNEAEVDVQEENMAEGGADDADPLRDDVDLIRRLLPRKAPEEIREKLWQQRSNPSRVKVVLNQMLEEEDATYGEEEAPSVPPANPLLNTSVEDRG